MTKCLSVISPADLSTVRVISHPLRRPITGHTGHLSCSVPGADWLTVWKVSPLQDDDQEASPHPLPSRDYFSLHIHHQEWRESGERTLPWWTHLTRSPRWSSGWWVDVIRCISRRRKFLWCSPKERGGQRPGARAQAPKIPSETTWTQTSHRKCTTC